MSNVNISKKRKFVADGVFQAELNEFFVRTPSYCDTKCRRLIFIPNADS